MLSALLSGIERNPGRNVRAALYSLHVLDMPYARVNNIRLYYEIRGEGEPLVFIHGLGSCASDWWRQQKFFSAHYRVIACDLRGHGNSSKPKQGYSIALFADDVANLLSQLAIVQAHLVGVSLGGMVAFQIAADNPHLVKSVTAVNSVPEVKFDNAASRMTFFLRTMVTDLFPMPLIALFLAGRLFPKKSQYILKKTFIKRWNRNDTNAYRKSFHTMKGFNVTERLKTFLEPVLMISGERDFIPLEVKEKYARLIPNAKVKVIKGSRHATPIDSPGEFNMVLGSFIRQVEREKEARSA